MKRVFDVAVAGATLLVLSPLIAFVALAVKLESKGPVIFRQMRVGMAGSTFAMFKFRTMRHVDAERQPLGDAGRGTEAWTKFNDDRITACGRFLRRTSLDELPQLFNVLLGDMSLIGPRPYVGFELDHCTTDQRAQRSSVRPGISGLSQVSGRSTASQAESIRRDLDYVERCSLALDLRLALRTVTTVFTGLGAN